MYTYQYGINSHFECNTYNIYTTKSLVNYNCFVRTQFYIEVPIHDCTVLPETPVLPFFFVTLCT